MNKRRATVIAAGTGVVGLCVLSIAAIALGYGAPFDWLMGAAVGLGLLLAAFASRLLSIALRGSVALCMDQNGISGYYVDPASWDEIADIRALRDDRDHTFLGFVLQDPIGFRERRGAASRLRVWSANRFTGVHLLVPQAMLKEARVESLAVQARALKAAASSDA